MMSSAVAGTTGVTPITSEARCYYGLVSLRTRQLFSILGRISGCIRYWLQHTFEAAARFTPLSRIPMYFLHWLAALIGIPSRTRILRRWVFQTLTERQAFFSRKTGHGRPG